LTAQRFALLALGRTGFPRPIGKMIRRRKLPEMAPESPASSARFVRLCFVAPDSLAVKDLPAKRLKKLLHKTLTLTIAKKQNQSKPQTNHNVNFGEQNQIFRVN